MLRYETLFLAVPEITADETASLESQLAKLIAEAKGTVLSYDRWGKYNLCYPIRRNDYGVYFLMRFEVEDNRATELLATLRTFLSVRQVNIVMRHIIVALSSKTSLEYVRPESLEEVPTRDVDTFLKENKMSGLIGSPKRYAPRDENAEADELAEAKEDSKEVEQ